MNIHYLPDEVFLNVFSFVPKEELMTTVPQVCRRWEDIAADPSLFRALKLAKDYPDTATAVRYLSTSTWLTSLELSGRTDTDDLLQHIGVNHPRLVKLVLDDCRGTEDKRKVSADELQHLLRRCTELQHFSLLKTTANSDTISTAIGLNLPNIRVVEMYSFNNTDLEKLINNCNAIEIFKLRPYGDDLLLSADVVAKFCDKFNESLTSVVIHNTEWTNASLASLSRCRNIKELYLNFSSQVTEEQIMSLCRLQKLEFLTIEDDDPNITSSVCVRFFENPSMRSLVKLRLSSDYVGDPVVSAISLLPNIVNLAIWRSEMTDEGLLALSNIPNLVRLMILYNEIITSQGWMRFFQTRNVKKMTHLLLYECSNVTDEVAQVISQNLQQLQQLKLPDPLRR